MVGLLQFMKRKRLSASKQVDKLLLKQQTSDSTSASLDDTEHEEPAWKAVAILSSTPIEEKDWWTNTSVSVDESSSTTDSPVEKDASMDSTESQFHNRGYEVWEQCRTAWRGDRDESAEQQQVSTPTRRSPKALTTYQKRQVTANLARQREYNLPRRLRLDQVVGIYQDIWSQGGSE